METLVTKASCQVEKIKVAEVQVAQELLLTDGACVKQREKIEGFFREVWLIFVIGVNDNDVTRSILYHLRVTIRIFYSCLTVSANN